MAWFSAAEINDAIARGIQVTATAADLPRKHQPSRGVEVTLTAAWDNTGEIRATARNYRGRFRVENVTIHAATYDVD